MPRPFPTLERSGLVIRPSARRSTGQASLYTLAANGREYTLAVLSRSRAPYPSELAVLSKARPQLTRQGVPVLHAPYVTESLGRLLAEAGWSWLDDHGNYELKTPGLLLQRRVSARPPRRSALQFKSRAAIAAIRWMISHPLNVSFGATQLARVLAVSQPRASQLLSLFAEHELLKPAARRQWLAQRATCLDAFLEHYADTHARSLFYYSLDEPLSSATRVAAQATVDSWAISADLAPDLVAPLRRPTHLVLYLRPGAVDETLFAWTKARSSSDANVIVRIPSDETVFGFEPWTVEVAGTRLPLVHPTQMLWDLHQLGGEDRTAAAEALKQWILERP